MIDFHLPSEHSFNSPNDYDDFNDFFIPMHTGKSLQIRATRSVS